MPSFAASIALPLKTDYSALTPPSPRNRARALEGAQLRRTAASVPQQPLPAATCNSERARTAGDRQVLPGKALLQRNWLRLSKPGAQFLTPTPLSLFSLPRRFVIYSVPSL